MSPDHAALPHPPGYVGHQTRDVEATLSLKRTYYLLLRRRIICYLDIEVIITKDLYTQLQDFQADRVAEDGDTA